MRREALPGAYAACRVVPAALGDRLGDVAALSAALEELNAKTQGENAEARREDAEAQRDGSSVKTR